MLLFSVQSFEPQEDEFVLKKILCTKAKHELLSKLTVEDRELRYENLIDRLFGFEEATTYGNVVLQQQPQDLECN